MKRRPVFLVAIVLQISRAAGDLAIALPAKQGRLVLTRNEAERPCAYCQLSPPVRRLVGDRRRLDPDHRIHLSKNPADRAGLRLTPIEQKRNIIPIATSPGNNAMPELSEISRYEQACDQAIAMCGGNLRSTIKALIMANEYLEMELEELQAAVAAGCAPAKLSRASSSAA
jgi:hypothetical protein